MVDKGNLRICRLPQRGSLKLTSLPVNNYIFRYNHYTLFFRLYKLHLLSAIKNYCQNYIEREQDLRPAL